MGSICRRRRNRLTISANGWKGGGEKEGKEEDGNYFRRIDNGPDKKGPEEEGRMEGTAVLEGEEQGLISSHNSSTPIFFVTR